MDRRTFLGAAASTLAIWSLRADAQSTQPRRGGNRKRRPNDYLLPDELRPFAALSVVLGRVTDQSITLITLSDRNLEAFIEYGTAPGQYTRTTPPARLTIDAPFETVLQQLQPNTEYFYRLHYRKPGAADFDTRPECRFHTQRATGETFTFAIQGDSHPERPQMSDPVLYARTLQAAAAEKPDFYICMGDDFSVAAVHEVNEASIAQRYLLQRPFIGLVAQTAPIFLLNGNHEQASLFNYTQTDERHDVAVLAQNARNRYYPTPAPDPFYGGDTNPLKSIGLLRDYYAWTWGDALFVVLDNYWHAPVLVDSGFHEQDLRDGKASRDWWELTLGDQQYRWFEKTLRESKTKFKFVFAHHVLGSGRGGVDLCDLYEWGGHNKRGEFEFPTHRPGWELPVHQLMVKYGVTIFFQGHDHLFARQEKDGIVYQECPMPADPAYQAYNIDRYGPGVKLPNSGYLKVTVSPTGVKVDYIRTYLPRDENAHRRSGELAHSYTIEATPRHA